MKTCMLLLILLSSISTGLSQPFTWARQFGGAGDENVSTVRLTTDGSIIVAGSCPGNCNTGQGLFADSASWVAKYDSSGNIVWIIRAGDYYYGTYTPNLYINLELSSQEYIYVTGHFVNTCTVGTISFPALTSSQNNIFLAKIDQDGNVLWAREIASLATANDIEIDINDNLIITGLMSDAAAFDSVTFSVPGTPLWPDIFLAKYDSSGTLLWARQGGGSNHDHGFSVAADPAGNIFLGGVIGDDSDFDGIPISVSDDAGIVAKYNSSGIIQWVKECGYDCFAVAADDNGNCYAGGSINHSASFDSIVLYNFFNYGLYVSKLDASGNYLWAIDSEAHLNASHVSELKIGDNGNIYAIGSFQDTLLMDNVLMIQPGPLGSGISAFLIELTPAGQVIAGRRPSNNGTCDAFATAFDINNCNIILGGIFRDSPPALYFDNDSMLSAGMHDIYITRIGSCLSTDIAEHNDHQTVFIYPNPAKDLINIRIGVNSGPGTIEIYNPMGKIIYTHPLVSGNEANIIINDLAAGIYFISVIHESKIESSKFIIYE